jgi:Flp pilus assembly protein protease CpaA
LLLGTAIVSELQSQLIRDVFVLPGLLYFVVIRMLIGPDPRYTYFLAGAAAFTLLMGLSVVLRRVFGRKWIGGGVVKLFTTVAVAFGLSATARASFALIFLFGVGYFIASRLFQRDTIPSSPFITAAAFIAFAWQHL